MMPDSNPWWVVIAAAVPSGASGVWVVWQWWAGRSDKKTEVTLTREERLMRDMDARVQTAAKIDADLIAQGRTEITRLIMRCEAFERQRDALEADRDRGWDLARWWNRRAHELRHAGVNAQQVAQRLAVSSCPMPGGQPLPPWPDMTIPGLEEP